MGRLQARPYLEVPEVDMNVFLTEMIKRLPQSALQEPFVRDKELQKQVPGFRPGKIVVEVAVRPLVKRYRQSPSTRDYFARAWLNLWAPTAEAIKGLTDEQVTEQWEQLSDAHGASPLAGAVYASGRAALLPLISHAVREHVQGKQAQQQEQEQEQPDSVREDAHQIQEQVEPDLGAIANAIARQGEELQRQAALLRIAESRRAELEEAAQQAPKVLSLEAAVTKLRKQVDQVRSEAEDYDRERRAVQTKLNEKNVEIEEWKRQLNDTKQIVQRSQVDAGSATAARAAAEKRSAFAETELQVLREQLHVRDVKLQQLNARIAQVSRQRDDVAHEARSAVQQLRATEGELEGLRAERADLLVQLDLANIVSPQAAKEVVSKGHKVDIAKLLDI